MIATGSDALRTALASLLFLLAACGARTDTAALCTSATTADERIIPLTFEARRRELDLVIVLDGSSSMQGRLRALAANADAVARAAFAVADDTDVYLYATTTGGASEPIARYQTPAALAAAFAPLPALATSGGEGGFWMTYLGIRIVLGEMPEYCALGECPAGDRPMLVVLLADSPSDDGFDPDARFPGAGLEPTARMLAERGARVVAVYANGERVARDVLPLVEASRGFGLDDQPIAVEAGVDDFPARTIDVLHRAAREIRFDLDVAARPEGSEPGAVRGVRVLSAIPEPRDGLLDTHVLGVLPGTVITLELNVDTSRLPAGRTTDVIVEFTEASGRVNHGQIVSPITVDATIERCIPTRDAGDSTRPAG